MTTLDSWVKKLQTKNSSTRHCEERRQKPPVIARSAATWQSWGYIMKAGYIYIMTNQKNGTVYVGVTSDLIKRVYEHKNGLCDGFTKKYNLKTLVYYEVFEEIVSAIIREKQLKAGNRKKKIELIESLNPNWSDLYPSLLD
jgi:putative endonuclease